MSTWGARVSDRAGPHSTSAPTLPVIPVPPLTFFITCSLMRSRSSSISRMSSSSFFGSYTFSSCSGVKQEAGHIEGSRATSLLGYSASLHTQPGNLNSQKSLGPPCHSW